MSITRCEALIKRFCTAWQFVGEKKNPSVVGAEKRNYGFEKREETFLDSEKTGGKLFASSRGEKEKKKVVIIFIEGNNSEGRRCWRKPADVRSC